MPEIKKKILRAALNQFLTYGKSGAKTKAIADNAGVNKALIHYYFSNKDMLFKACVNWILQEMEGTFHTNEVKSLTNYKEYISALIGTYTKFIENHNKHITFLLWEHLNDRELLDQIKETLGSSHLKDFIEKTEHAIKNRVIRDVNPLDIYLNMVSLVLSTYMILPITLSFLGEESEDRKSEIMNSRKKEVEKLLWNDIKENK